jgi:hypothetical protein
MKLLIAAFGVLLPVAYLSAQDFVNLNFDNPDLSGSLRPIEPGSSRTPFYGEASRLLPGWTLRGNGLPLNQIAYQPSLGDTIDPVTLIRTPVNGGFDYAFAIHSLPLSQVDLSFQQTGRIPADVSGIAYYANGSMELRINGNLVYTADPLSGTAYPIVDVSRYAGQVVDLEFHVFQRPFLGALFNFDVIGFTQVPEPSTYAMFALGTTILAFAVKKQQRKQRRFL